MPPNPAASDTTAQRAAADYSIGRIVSVTGSKAIVLLDGGHSPGEAEKRGVMQKPEMGTLLAIDTPNTVALAIVSALSVPVPVVPRMAKCLPSRTSTLIIAGMLES